MIEDKIVQGATVEILNCIYEVDFRSCSYGFRPGRSQHQALQSLQTVLQKGRVNWVLDLDLKACLESNEVEAGEFDERFGAQGFGRSVYIKDPEGNVVELRSQIQGDPAG